MSTFYYTLFLFVRELIFDEKHKHCLRSDKNPQKQAQAEKDKNSHFCTFSDVLWVG